MSGVWACENNHSGHRYRYIGIVYAVGPLEGIVRTVSYYDCFYCERCLGKSYRRLDHSGDYMDGVEFGARPK